jgi:hypothetical protein
MRAAAITTASQLTNDYDYEYDSSSSCVETLARSLAKIECTWTAQYVHNPEPVICVITKVVMCAR